MIISKVQNVPEMISLVNRRMDDFVARLHVYSMSTGAEGFTATYITDEEGNFSQAYTFYYGCGHHAYIFTNATEEEIKFAVGDGKRGLEFILQDIQKIDSVAEAAWIDCEMGGVAVFNGVFPYN